MDRVCATCGYENPIGANFCMSCGAPMPRVTSDLHTASMEIAITEIFDGVDRPRGMFVVRQGSKAGSRISLDAPVVTIGRHPESDIFLDDITVSRRHAEVHRADDGFDVVDAGSLNGTYVNKVLVERARLDDGDELQVGKFKLVFLAIGEDE